MSSDNVVNVGLDFEKFARLGFKVMEFLARESKGSCEHLDIVNEYWALQFAVLFYESGLNVKFDNKDEVVLALKQFIGSLMREV